MEESFLSKSYSNEEETCYEAYKNSNSSDEEQLRFFRKKNINRITQSDSDSDINKCSDSECDVDIIDHNLQKLVLEEERKVDIEESTCNLAQKMERIQLSTTIIFFYRDR